jgi:hypothetical protein
MSPFVAVPDGDAGASRAAPAQATRAHFTPEAGGKTL